jgi:hypothetical protein
MLWLLGNNELSNHFVNSFSNLSVYGVAKRFRTKEISTDSESLMKMKYNESN